MRFSIPLFSGVALPIFSCPSRARRLLLQWGQLKKIKKTALNNWRACAEHVWKWLMLWDVCPCEPPVCPQHRPALGPAVCQPLAAALQVVPTEPLCAHELRFGALFSWGCPTAPKSSSSPTLHSFPAAAAAPQPLRPSPQGRAQPQPGSLLLLWPQCTNLLHAWSYTWFLGRISHLGARSWLPQVPNAKQEGGEQK